MKRCPPAHKTGRWWHLLPDFPLLPLTSSLPFAPILFRTHMLCLYLSTLSICAHRGVGGKLQCC